MVTRAIMVLTLLLLATAAAATQHGIPFLLPLPNIDAHFSVNLPHIQLPFITFNHGGKGSGGDGGGYSPTVSFWLTITGDAELLPFSSAKKEDLAGLIWNAFFVNLVTVDPEFTPEKVTIIQVNESEYQTDSTRNLLQFKSSKKSKVTVKADIVPTTKIPASLLRELATSKATQEAMANLLECFLANPSKYPSAQEAAGDVCISDAQGLCSLPAVVVKNLVSKVPRDCSGLAGKYAVGNVKITGPPTCAVQYPPQLYKQTFATSLQVTKDCTLLWSNPSWNKVIKQNLCPSDPCNVCKGGAYKGGNPQHGTISGTGLVTGTMAGRCKDECLVHGWPRTCPSSGTAPTWRAGDEKIPLLQQLALAQITDEWFAARDKPQRRALANEAELVRSGSDASKTLHNLKAFYTGHTHLGGGWTYSWDEIYGAPFEKELAALIGSSVVDNSRLASLPLDALSKGISLDQWMTLRKIAVIQQKVKGLVIRGAGGLQADVPLYSIIYRDDSYVPKEYHGLGKIVEGKPQYDDKAFDRSTWNTEFGYPTVAYVATIPRLGVIDPLMLSQQKALGLAWVISHMDGTAVTLYNSLPQSVRNVIGFEEFKFKPKAAYFFRYFLCGAKHPFIAYKLNDKDEACRQREKDGDTFNFDSLFPQLINEDGNVKAFYNADKAAMERAADLLLPWGDDGPCSRSRPNGRIVSLFETKGPYKSTIEGPEGFSYTNSPDWHLAIGGHTTWSAVTAVDGKRTWDYNLRDNYVWYPQRSPEQKSLHLLHTLGLAKEYAVAGKKTEGLP